MSKPTKAAKSFEAPKAAEPAKVTAETPKAKKPAPANA